MRCDFSKNKSLVRAYAIYKAAQGNEDTYLAELQRAFNNWEDAKQAIDELVGGEVPSADSSFVPREGLGTFQLREDLDNIASYYVGGNGFLRMQSFFRERLLGTSILTIDKETGKFEYIDGNEVSGNITKCQSNILAFKVELVNNLLRTLNKPQVTVDYNISNDAYTNLVKGVLMDFETYLRTADQELLESNGVYDSYVILKNFDRLIDTYASYIKVDKSFSSKGLEGVTKYTLKPKVEHYSGFSGKDESADIMKQVSNLAETILRIIPEIEADGHILETSSIGVAGFNGAMETLKTALLYSNDFGDSGKAFRNAYVKQADVLLDPNSEYNISAIIDTFIENNRPLSGRSVSSFSEFRQVYLHNKLRGIEKLLFSENTPKYIQNMFIQMFYKTEPTSYRVYTTDETSKKFVGKDLKSRMIVTQKYAIQNVLISGLDMIMSGSKITANSLLDKYDVKIDSNGNVESITITNKATQHSATITYAITNGIIKGTSLVETDSEDVITSFMEDVYSYIIPDTYATCISSDANYDWKDDFAPFIALACKEALIKVGRDGGANANITTNDGTISLDAYNGTLLTIGQRLGVIYGDSVKSTIKGLSGNSLPLFQLTSLEYNWRMCLDDARSLGEDYNPQAASLFWENDDLLLMPQIRNEIDFNGKTKEGTRMALNELNKLGIFDDFFFPFINTSGEREDGIYLQNATFSDKARQFLPGYRLNTILKGTHVTSLYGEKATLRSIIQDAIDNRPSKLKELTRRIRRDKYLLTALRVLSDYQTAMPEIGIRSLDSIEGDDDAFAQAYVKELQKVDAYLLKNNKTLNNLRSAFDKVGIPFKEEIHAYKPKADGLGKARINETFLAYLTAASSIDNWNARMNFCRGKFMKNISSLVLNGFDYGSNEQIKSIEAWSKEHFNHSNYYDSITREYSLIGKDGNLNPIADAYFFIDVLLSNEYNSLTMGEIWAHPNKNKDVNKDRKKLKVYNEADFLEFSEANRLVNQVKRSVIFGSTIHPFAQGITNEEGYKCGVTEFIDIAIIEDEPGKVFTPNGIDSTVDSQDGSGHCTALQANLENNSEVDAAAGMSKKTIVHDIDHRYGTPTLLKWAVYALTNSVRRNGFGSKANVENLVARMYGKDISDKIAQLSLDTDYQEYIKTNGTIHIKNPIRLKVEELIAVKNLGDGSYTQVLKDVDGNIRESAPIVINTLYGIDQLFGGAWTCDVNGVGNEDSVNLLTAAAIKYDLRDRQIAYAVNASACKVGATNLNSNSRWTDGGELKTYQIHTKYAGIMMDADHELEEADVTEMSQMISALIEDGHYTELVTNIYKEIGEIAINNAKVNKFKTAIKNKDKKVVAELLGRSLIASFQTGNKDTIGLAQAFIKRLDLELKRAKSKGQVEGQYSSKFMIPFSDATIFGAFVSDVTSRFSKDCIRRKYEGYAGVLNPSHNMIQYFVSADGAMMFDQFNAYCKERLGTHSINLETGKVIGASGREYSSWQELAMNEPTLDGGEPNPFWTKVDNVDFEDTLMVLNEDGKTYSSIYVDDFKTYDAIRNLGILNGKTVLKNTAAPRNLRGTDTTFTVRTIDGTLVGTYSYYNIDSVRASQYISSIKKFDPGMVSSIIGSFYADQSIRVLTPEEQIELQKYLLIEKVLNRAAAEGIDITKPVEACNQLTQNFLEKLDLGKARVVNTSYSPDLSEDDKLAEFEYQECFSPEYKDSVFYVSDYTVRPAEIIMGRYQMSKLGVTDSDHINHILNQGESFFYDRIKDGFTPPAFNPKVEAYDKVLYHKGVPFLVKIGTGITHGNDGLYESACTAYNIVGDDMRFESEVILTNETDDNAFFDRYKFSTIDDHKGTSYTLITVDSEKAFEDLAESDFFDGLYRNHIESGNIDLIADDIIGRGTILDANHQSITREVFNTLSDEDKRRLLISAEKHRIRSSWNRLARDRWEAFNQAINYVGARIPTQAMQSFMPFTCIAFTDTDKNQVYVPKANTHIEGSDFDIDKLYLLAATVLRNGKIQSGSALQNIVGYEIASQLLRPTGTTFISQEGGYPISQKLLNDFTAHPDNWTQVTKENFILTINQLIRLSNGQDSYGINFIYESGDVDEFNGRVEKFLKLINKHSPTKSYLRDSLDSLKTRVFGGIRRVTLSAQNQLKSQITVDTCTGELKAKAANTESGNAEKEITPDNPASKFVMQEQNILGKAVVGIGAVSLKTYFILSTSYNNKVDRAVEAIQNGNVNLAKQLIESLVIVSPITEIDGSVRLTTLANTNLDKLIRVLNAHPEVATLRSEKYFSIPISELVNSMKYNTKDITAPEFLSGIISLATDNAKDLALPKLNATEDLVDIYTTAGMIGITFEEISNIMVSSIFNWMTRVGEENIFDDVTLNAKVKRMVDFALLQGKGNFDKITVPYTLTEYNRKAKELGLPEIPSIPGKWEFGKYHPLNDPTVIDNVITALTMKGGLIDTASEKPSTVMDVDENGNEVPILIWSKKEWYKALRMFRLYKERLQFFTKINEWDNYDKLTTLQKLLVYVEEMSTLGGQGNINQGLKTNVRDFYNFGRRVESFINQRIKKAKAREGIWSLLTKKGIELDPESPAMFDMNKFLLNEDYANSWIEIINSRKDILSCFNILEALKNSPNFYSMSQVYPYANEALLMTSNTYRMEYEIADKLMGDIKTDDVDTISSLSSSDFREMERYIGDLYIYNFLKNSGFEVNIDQISRECNLPIETYENIKSVDYTSKKTIKLDSAINIASFKHIMEHYIIPELKRRYGRTNAFIESITMIKNQKLGTTTCALPIDMMNIDADEGSLSKYSKYLEAFNRIAKDSFAGHNIGGLFFLYNLIVNKNSFGKQSLTRIFEDLVNIVHPPKEIDEYFRFIGAVDRGDITIDYKLDEAAYRIAKGSRGTKVKTDLKIEQSLLPDFTLDLPKTGNLIRDNIVDPESVKLISWTPIGKLNPGDAIRALADTINSKRPNLVRVIDEEYRMKNQLPLERGFIKDGVVYINQSRFNDTASAIGVGIHELAHLVFAAIKSSKDDSSEKQTYYKLLHMIHQDPEYNEIASRYQDRVGSDLDEEVLCNKIERLLTNTLLSNSNVELGLLESGLLLDGIQKLFPERTLTFEQLIGMNLEDAIEYGAYSLFNFTERIAQDYIIGSQKLASLKTKLYESEDTEYNLKQDCE